MFALNIIHFEEWDGEDKRKNVHADVTCECASKGMSIMTGTIQTVPVLILTSPSTNVTSLMRA